MWAESCNIPNRDYLSSEFQLPQELRDDISWGVRSEILDCWLDTLIDTSNSSLESKLILELRNWIILWLHESNFTLSSLDITDPELWLSSTIEKVIHAMTPYERLFLSQQNMQVVIIWGIAFNYSRHLQWDNLTETRLQYFSWLYSIFWNHDKTYFDTISVEEKQYLEWVLWSSDITEISSYQSIFEELWIVSGVNESLRPIVRPQEIVRRAIYDDKVEWEKWVNQYEVLDNDGFSPEIVYFIENDLFPRVCWDWYECWVETIARLRRLSLLIIDMETSQWVNLRNWEIDWVQTLPESRRSSASWYFHHLNQHWRIDTNGDWDINYNTVDTNLRYAADLYNTWVIDIPTQEHEYKLREVHRINIQSTPNAQWVIDLWDYNSEGKDAIEFTFDDQIKMFLVRTMFEDSNALRWILLGDNIPESARAIYEAHHTAVDTDTHTEWRLNDLLSSHYLN
jgi:hypothetical protein